MRGRDKFEKYKFIIMLLVRIASIFPLKIRLKLLEQFRMTKGNVGLVLRYTLLKTIALNCGDNVSIHSNVYLMNPQYLYLGNNVSIHPMSYIEALGGVKIESNVSIAHGVTIMSTEHKFDNPDIFIKNQELVKKNVLIKENVWIGAKATILAGNTIGCGSIVAAMAVVTKDVKGDNIVGGVPAKVLKSRV